MFWHDQFLRMFWDDTLGRATTGLWGVAWAEWIAIAFLWVLVWRHGHAVLHQRRHPPGVALAAALLPILGVVANPRPADERIPGRPRLGALLRRRPRGHRGRRPGDGDVPP
ncbi:MAG TPA: hypothetical protein VGH96_05800 [Streptosporangiaceae bacterium]